MGNCCTPDGPASDDAVSPSRAASSVWGCMRGAGAGAGASAGEDMAKPAVVPGGAAAGRPDPKAAAAAATAARSRAIESLSAAETAGAPGSDAELRGWGAVSGYQPAVGVGHVPAGAARLGGGSWPVVSPKPANCGGSLGFHCAPLAPAWRRLGPSIRGSVPRAPSCPSACRCDQGGALISAGRTAGGAAVGEGRGGGGYGLEGQAPAFSPRAKSSGAC